MLVFHNQGLIPLEAFTTFGINAKPNSENPIGYFGTGLKYAVAVTLRLGGVFRLFRGEEEYEFYLKETDFRGKEFSMIRMKKRKRLPVVGRWQYSSLPFSTELGKNWEPWMAVREIESNTRDEDGQSFSYIGASYPDYMASLRGVQGAVGEGRTCIVIECREMEDAYDQLETIFMPEKKLLHTMGQLEIYEGSSNYLFFRGLRITDLAKPSHFTYNFTTGLTITEDRTSKFPYLDMHTIMEAIMRIEDVGFVEGIMDLDEDEWYEGSLPFDQPYVTPSTTFMGALGSRVTLGGTVPKRMKTYYRSIQTVSAAEETLSVKLKVSEWRELLGLLGELDDDDLPKRASIVEGIEAAMKNEEIPF